MAIKNSDKQHKEKIKVSKKSAYVFLAFCLFTLASYVLFKNLWLSLGVLLSGFLISILIGAFSKKENGKSTDGDKKEEMISKPDLAFFLESLKCKLWASQPFCDAYFETVEEMSPSSLKSLLENGGREGAEVTGSQALAVITKPSPVHLEGFNSGLEITLVGRILEKGLDEGRLEENDINLLSECQEGLSEKDGKPEIGTEKTAVIVFSVIFMALIGFFLFLSLNAL